ncbi:MAG TPA: PHP domain-containing protein [Candidatus Sulfotelmatobacter sp.]|nr:PHP domain-containing protein [Candidatus Sulfotelmatobacter sp.]
MLIDLHTHTTASDGILTPAALVHAVRTAGVEVFSITDHDSVDGCVEAETLARDAKLRLIPGIELSVYWRHVELHVLGYFLDARDAELLGFLARMRSDRLARLHQMIGRCWAMGMQVSAEEALAHARDGNVGRPHLARVLVERGVVATMDEAFDRYLGTDKPAYVPRPEVSPADAIRVIHEAGGLASLAHPGIHNRDEAIADLAAAGLDALEVYHPNHVPYKAARYRRLAAARGLLITGGSDFHGAIDEVHASAPGTPNLPEDDFRRLEVAAASRHAGRR